MLEATISALIIFGCTTLAVYWASRISILLHDSDDRIDEVLEADLWWGRRLVLGLRSLFIPPNQLAM